MLLTVLVENSPGHDGRLLHEHGLSMYIEANGTRVLFDLGQSSRFAHNAEVLGVDLSTVDMAIISHGHYDHGGGLSRFLELNHAAPVYMRHGADGSFHAIGPLETRYIGLDPWTLKAHSERIIWLDDTTEVAPGIHLLTRIPGSEERPAGNRGLMVKRGRGLVRDDFCHELFCVVVEEDGMTVITGCGHSGIANMVLAAREGSPGRELKAVVGGFHLSGGAPGEPAADVKGVDALIRSLAGHGCPKVVTGHCTGKEAISILRNRLGERSVALCTGMRIAL
ncbi:MAG TPA: MBL fold metallo-hydrolase [Methanomassiliicoccaceae archaeon]|jgi:7,8-dihydropterin-6-yl-methyl-4-(beta-D-ribofuranosyl)aminobenzene 5'-phosphate synthase|nr:MBL fold metallo-hydrolase [Methanomassiliicoccaceae archaeon]HOL07174.1 MBL fold metallo-hydrolase [Methanomassiliicoccaceae archaeon]HPT73950.1 MBL fold metallo-hydrolase [Methanomassiliicoccaceae archaeon]HQA21135.1 MBL fold metallo-hydrolase [Methanomassiliicoccaceae archaeon]HQD88145.1 MBL fold metallo-hydrolase [Methanomassiliicoccaceae archaeon]